ncbi:MAG: hypothetical protein A3H96_10670 [Acidobacteria bacterium RIFCSPLOWO2_02_FULL_67_36]|nr:MAG: hypothetical protein A3H96_10670 [Acidobacteria bacterium RIFCSPLOWO2_02_FULL_67_36]OFW24362.1 MAG: hypothetical protein A3G21_17500 [Acidobacteria bacterium RIFCSPLOWO2_12_FULL_66_21]
MSRAKAVAVVVLLLSYGAVGARQPAVRSAVRLPVSAHVFASSLGLAEADTATLLLHVVRLVHLTPDQGAQRRPAQEALHAVLSAPRDRKAESVPLPLDPSIWRDTILQAQVSDDELVGAILSDPRASLLYHGLAALDDETLGWLGPERETLLHLRTRAAIFAAFGRSVHVRAGRVLVPGGAEAEPLWKSVVGADPGKPAAFVHHLIGGNGRLAFLYDTIAHLDEPRQRFALGLQLRTTSRADRLHDLLDAFTRAAPDWRTDERPFARPPIDGAMLLSTIDVAASGALAPPVVRRIWERVYRDDELTDVAFADVSATELQLMSALVNVDAAWLAARILSVPYALGRRRLDTLLFAQRVFGGAPTVAAADVATALRGYAAFPALMLSLERSGITDPAVYAAAAKHAAELSNIDSIPVRRTAIAEFQASVAIIGRARRSGVLPVERAWALVVSLCRLELSQRNGYGPPFARWFQERLIPELSRATPLHAEHTVLTAMAGVSSASAAPPIVVWEDRQYRVDPADAELRRLRLVRQRQGGASLDEALAAVQRDTGGPAGNRRDAERLLADTLVSVVYAAYLGDPDGDAVTSGNVALRHDFGLLAQPPVKRASAAWRLPAEHFDAKAWRVSGSILGLETALGRLMLRRLDSTAMPAEPKLPPQDRQTVMLTAALLNPFAMSDAARDEIAAAIGRGRARAAALSNDPGELDAVARAAGLSEWRRNALAWSVEHDRDSAVSRFSLLELFWLGAPRPAVARALDAWGAASLPLTGCLCLEMPRTRPWEEVARRSSAAMLGTRAVDVALHIADTLASLRLPASLAPAIGGYAMQDVMERTQPAYPDDWDAFGRAAMALPADRLSDYIAALTAGGPLVAAGARAASR